MAKKNENLQVQATGSEEPEVEALEAKVANGTIKITEFIEGALNVDQQSGISGWLWDRSRPYLPLAVELVVNDDVIAQAVADKFDMDLAEREIGNGKHAFLLRAKSWPNLPLPLDLSVRITGTTYILGRVTIQSLADIAGLAESTPVGYVDGVIDGEIQGWVFDLANPSTPLSVDISDNGNLIATFDCVEYREDLDSAGYAEGKCGFSFPLGTWLLDGEIHSLSVCYSGTQRRLPNGTLQYGLTKESDLTKYIDNLILAVNQCKTELASVEQRLIARHEALLAIQRENMEREMQVLRKLLIPNADKQNCIPAETVIEPKIEKQSTQKPKRAKNTAGN